MGKVVKFGSIAIDQFDGIKMLTEYADKEEYSSFELPVDTKYQVPVGKLFRVGLVFYNSDVVKAMVSIGYGDDSVNNSVTPPTNAIIIARMLPVGIANQMYNQDVYFYIPAEKYPFMYSSDGVTSVNIIGLEE